MDFAERLAKERRARLQAERLLEQKSRELYAANERLALHARALSDQIVKQRYAVQSAISEAETLKGQNSRFMTDLEKAHSVAVTAEQRLWEAINTIGDGFALFGPDRRLAAANRAYQALFGDDPLEVGTPYEEALRRALAAGVMDASAKDPEVWVADMLARWDMSETEPFVMPLTNGNWMRKMDRRTLDGGMVSLVQDITEQMRTWAAIEAIPDGFVLFDRQDRLISCNQRYRDLYSAAASAIRPGVYFEDILRAGLAQGLHVDALGREEEWLADRMRSHLLAEGASEQNLADGRWIRVYDHSTPDGGRVGLRIDITPAKEQQAALEAARAAAEAANRAKSAFLANMSHEIRTPMNGVVGMAELLCDTDLSEEQKLFAETIRSSGEALLVIINDILDYSKIEAERLTLHPEPFDLERTIHEVAMLLQPRAKAKGIDIMIDFDMFLPTYFVGDPGRLRQILTNLLGNAVKFTDQGHVLIRVVGIEQGDGTQDLHVTVEDTGIGIPAEHLDNIFGEFNQVESAANRKFEGTGLGLAITRRLVEHMGGSVWVDSELGKGSSFGFRLSLPVAEESGAAELPQGIRRALVVHAQLINRTILERQLTPCGIQVTFCRSGADVLALLDKDQDFELLLADQDLSDMDGLTLAARLRDKGCTVPVLLMSVNPMALREQGADELLAGIVQKPVLRSELYRKLRFLAGEPTTEALAPVADMPVNLRLMRVLTAEDNRTNQLVFRKMVKDLAIELEFANNGAEAVDLFGIFRPDLIFMDISMPEMDGRQATRAIRLIEAEEGGHVPICALTAHAMDGDEADILAAGIDQYMTKPLRRAAIVETLLRHRPQDTQPPLEEPTLPAAQVA
ncbi:hybrid sensor histidine kinase/response regulator [Neogemmobacter tilapiae]|uniref:Sensory/regulatory protein RpfC n=1 Tax=Neogemmobacter tilapiae TaxID=875041 RepID=A0A918WLN7_9RHOB|nr:PAS-domain containing protein [Gemmobacter tilapiae]GHC56943.1 sensor histidine kinase [Gemmobacter tilapiae]